MRVSECSNFDPCDTQVASSRSDRGRRASGGCAPPPAECAPAEDCGDAAPRTDWSSCAPRPTRPDAGARADALFNALDADQNGEISECEFKDGAKALLRQGGGHHVHGGYGRHGRLDRMLGRLFDKVDGDGDGAITKDELTAALTRRAGAPAPQPVQDPAPVAPGPEAGTEPPPVEATPDVPEPLPVGEVATPIDVAPGLDPLPLGETSPTPVDAPPAPDETTPLDLVTPAPVAEEAAPVDASPAPASDPTAPAEGDATVVLNLTVVSVAVRSYSLVSQAETPSALRVVTAA